MDDETFEIIKAGVPARHAVQGVPVLLGQRRQLGVRDGGDPRHGL